VPLTITLNLDGPQWGTTLALTNLRVLFAQPTKESGNTLYALGVSRCRSARPRNVKLTMAGRYAGKCGSDEARLPRILPSRADRSASENSESSERVTFNGPKINGILTQRIYPKSTNKPDPEPKPQPPMAETIRLHASSFSARTPNSSVTPWVFEYVILHLTNAFPAPPAPTTNPASCSV
jgi:hypothetical protein